MEKYWIVIGNIASARPFHHTSEKSANMEAIRLAGINPAQEFTVFESKRKMIKQEIVTIEAVENLPF